MCSVLEKKRQKYNNNKYQNLTKIKYREQKIGFASTRILLHILIVIHTVKLSRLMQFDA